MKKVKKIFAILLALTMALGMGVTTLAADKPKSTDAKAVKIDGVEEGAAYKAYQIIDATYNENGFTGYVWAPGTGKTGAIEIKKESEAADGLTQVEGLDNEFISSLAANPAGLTEKENYSPSTTPLEVGTWMILVTPPGTNPTKNYNPMIVSVYYSTTGSGQSNVFETGSLDASKPWSLETSGAFMKSNDTGGSETKEVDKETDEVGKVVKFTLGGTIPSYSSQYYTDPVYNLTDIIENGLKYVDQNTRTQTGTARKGYGDFVSEGKLNPSVMTIETNLLDNDGNKVALKDSDYSITYQAAGGTQKESFKITFAPEFIKSVANKPVEQRKVTVTYYAEITTDAITKLGENTFKIDFSNKPGETKDAETKEYVYTLSLDGVLKKVDEDDEVLPNAKFTLYEKTSEDLADTDTANYTEVKTVTETDGNIQFQGLDGEKTYYLREVEAPSGYSLNGMVYKIEFVDLQFEKDAKDQDTHKLKTYKVQITPGTRAEDGTVTWETAKDKIVTSAAINYGQPADLNVAYKIENTKLSALPSTGGIGTTIFTIGGCALMIIAAGLYFATRRKNVK